MGQSPNHTLFVCTSCRHKGSACKPGFYLIARLCAAIAAAGDAISDDFEISGVACMAGCDHPCTIGYQASKKASYLFGDIDPNEDIEALIAFAKLYQGLDDGWCSGKLYPDKLRRNTLARIPAMIMVEETADGAVQ